MGVFGKTYSETVPQGSALANTLDTVIQEDKVAINERYKLEHNAFDASGTGQNDSDSANAQGRHLPGKVACTYIGTTAQIAALTGMVSGSLAYDTDLGILKIYNGTNWTTYIVSNSPVSGTELLVSIFGSAALAAAGANLLGSWGTAPSTIANIFDKSDSTNWGTATISSDGNVAYYWDLGATYSGHMLIRGQAKSSNGGSLSLFCSSEVLTLVKSGHLSGGAFYYSTTNAYTKFSYLYPFHGRYVGIRGSSSSASTTTIEVDRLEVYGSAV